MGMKWLFSSGTTPQTSRPSSVRVPVCGESVVGPGQPLRAGNRGPTALPETHLVEANQADLPAEVDTGRADAEDALFLQPVLGVDGAHRHRSRQSRGHDDGDKVEGTDDDLPHGDLAGKEGEGWAS